MFKKYSLKAKILVMVGPLVFWLSLVSLYMINDFHRQRTQLNGLAQVANAFDDFGELMDALQTERAKSAIYLANGNVTKEELEKLYKEVSDVRVTEVKRMLAVELPFKKEDSDQMIAIIDTINSIRKEILDRNFSIDDMRSAYGSLIKELLLTEGVMTRFYSAKSIEINLVNMTFVEALKDNIGKSRGVFTNVFAKNRAITNKEEADIESVKFAVKALQDSPALELVPSMKAKITEIFETADWQELEANMDSIIEKAPKGNFGVDANVFYSKMTSVNDKLKEIIASERKGLITFAQNEATKARNYFYGVLIFVILTVIGILIFCWYVISELITKEAADLVANLAAVRSASMVDNSSVATMMCDLDGKLIYMNPASTTNLKKLQEFLPEKVENLIGKSIDIFHKDPGHIRQIISDPKNLPHHAIISVGPEKLDITVTASVDQTGNYLGVATLWSIVTSKVELIKDLTTSAESLASAAGNVLSISANLSAAAEETYAQANSASLASTEVRDGVQTVAGNMEQMVSAIKEITKTTNEAAHMTNEAMRMANSTNQIINKLGESSMDIGNVIKVISSIAQQTNLLALNATIEAARAGEAGKGFAVVANEVKELANQTAKATAEITKKIETIQSDSQSAVAAIAEISSAIEKVNGFTSNIAASVEEQAATTNEVTRIVTESAEGVRQITENIAQVTDAAANTGRDAGDAQTASKNVEDIAESLKKYVNRLKVE
jgi:methyl-accepting chemotaxis protein